ncbi:E3 ubiquitin-protein ligase TRIM65 [Microcaecilia unicolor]|uniref:Tripartite motif-containing protein 65 n=1 Tax=Microcaecilia unicolor TaxID=1415580 RepID=A0A6P7YM16_9AMPH|nr:tripartite motif-containing protein 65 [Microcaecilia unicolor]
MAATTASITSEDLREKLSCAICLELYKDPGTVPCGHSFCRPCVSGHWDSEEQAQGWAGTFSCPTCRQCYQKRPELERSVALNNLVEEVQAASTGGSHESAFTSGPSSPGQAAAAGPRCARHDRPLQLYCSTEKRCICYECTVRECQEHKRVLAGDERRAREDTLKERLLKNESQLKCTKAEIQKLETQMTTYRDTSERSISGISVRFDQLQKAFEVCKTLVVQSMEMETATALEQAKKKHAVLQSRLDSLGQYQQQAEELCQHADDVTFLEAFSLLPPLGNSKSLPNIMFNNMSKVEAVTAVLSELSRLIEKELPNTLHPGEASDKIQGSESKTNAAVKSEPSFSPKSELRTQLFHNYRNLTFDPNTAHKYIQLSKGNQEATHMISVTTRCPVHPERFESCWQVLCTESFGEGCHYWEVKVSDYFVYVGMAYGNIERKKKCKTATIGRNASSWSLQLQHNCHTAWTNGKEWKLDAPLYSCIGVYLDFSAGTLSFYGIKDKMELLHTFHCVFSAPLYPAFWIGEDVAVTLCQVP